MRYAVQKGLTQQLISVLKGVPLIAVKTARENQIKSKANIERTETVCLLVSSLLPQDNWYKGLREGWYSGSQLEGTITSSSVSRSGRQLVTWSSHYREAGRDGMEDFSFLSYFQLTWCFCGPRSRWTFPPQVTLSGNSLLDTPRDVPPADSKSQYIDNLLTAVLR